MVALLGVWGTGKTVLGVSLIHHACRRGKSARYLKRSEFADKVFQNTESDILDKLARADLLVLDEFQRDTHSDFSRDLLTGLLDKRYNARRDTLLIGKHKFAELAGSSIVSRIHEIGGVIECQWPSFRTPGMWNETRAV